LDSYYFIVNPVSGRGRARNIAGKLKNLLKQNNVAYQMVQTRAPWHAAELAEQAVGKFPVVVVVGGDGTFNEVLNGVFGKKISIGLIPVGSGNDFVRSTDIPFDPEQALKKLLNGQPRRIDVGKANDRYFHNGLGIGFDAWTVHTSLNVRFLRGNAMYLYAVLRTLRFYKPNPVNIKMNGRVLQKDYFMISIGNGGSMGGGFKLTPDAKIDDNVLDVCLIQNMPTVSILKNLIKVYSGKHKDDPRVSILQTERLEITSEKGFALHADGELIDLHVHELRVETMPSALEIIC